jgi:uncharacterized protein (TIGR03083 family)
VFDFTTAPAATERELADLRDRLAVLEDSAWERPVRCAGWTITDLVAHLVGAATGQAGGLRAAASRCEQLATLDPPDSRDPAKLRDLLKDAHAEVLEALAALNPECADATVPLPFGPVPAILALQIVPLEYGFHHNDLRHALGEDRALPADIATALIEILPGLLPVLARGSAVGNPGQTPSAPVTCRLVSPSGSTTVAFDGDHWSPTDDTGDHCEIDGDDNAIALYAMGRIAANDVRLHVSDPTIAAQFKAWFPGP